MISKCYSRPEIRSKFHDGQVIMTGGFAFHGIPDVLMELVLESGAKHLTVIALDASCEILLHSGAVDKVILAHAGAKKKNLELLASGKIEVEFCPMGTIAERMRAAGAGLGGILVKTGMGTVADHGQEHIIVDGEEYMLETPLHADVALVRASSSDLYGNLLYNGAARNSNPLVAMAGDLTIVQTDELRKLDTVPPENVVTPGIFTDMILDPQMVYRGGVPRDRS